MQERIIEIIVYLLEEFQDTPQEEYDDLSEQLMARGYTESEINLAFSWIFNHLQKPDTLEDQEVHYQENSIRVLHDLEKLIIHPDGYGYLLQLHQLGILNANDMEEVIERALSMGSSNITLDEIKGIANMLIFNADKNPAIDSFFFHPGTNTVH